jgi:hypothetical protein
MVEHSTFDLSQVQSWTAPESVRVAALMPGLMNNDGAVRLSAVMAYSNAFGQIGIESDAPLIRTIELFRDPDPKIRAEAQRTIIKVSKWRSVEPGLSKVLDAIERCTDVEEAKDLGNVMACLHVSPLSPALDISRIVKFLESGSDSAKIAAARTLESLVVRSRGWMTYGVTALGLSSEDEIALVPIESLLAAIRNADASEVNRIYRQKSGDDGEPKTFDRSAREYGVMLQMQPIFAQALADKNVHVREYASGAVAAYQADCKLLLPNVTALFADMSSTCRTNAYTAATSCTSWLKEDKCLLELLEKERSVVPLAVLISAVPRLSSIPSKGMVILRHFASLEANEAELKAKNPHREPIGSGFIVKQAQAALEVVERRLRSN